MSSRTLSLMLALTAMFTIAGCQDKDLNGGPTVAQLQPPDPEPKKPPFNPCANPPSTADLEVVFNEFLFDNVSAHPDEDGAFSAWVELYNPSATETYNMGGIVISMADSLFTFNEDWTIPCTAGAIMGPGDYLLIYLDGDTADEDDFHASLLPDRAITLRFFLNQASDTVVLTPSDHVTDFSVGRVPDRASGPLELLATPTPGATNSGTFLPPEVAFVRGDANGNGVLDSEDPAAEAAFVTGAVALPSCVDRLDVDDNGLLNITDVTYLAAQIVQPMPLIPAPFPDAGLDPTTDALTCFAP